MQTIQERLFRQIPLLTMVIWGSMYVAGRVVLQNMPALMLLFLRLSVSGLLLLAAAKAKGLKMIRKEDLKEILVIAFLGYFISNGALLLGIQYSGAGVASLLNALTPITISIFAMLMLREKMTGRDCIALLVAVAGAIVIIGNPGSGVQPAGIFLNIFSLIIWSYVTIRVKKLTARYNPLVVTGTGMALGAIPTLPAALIWMRVTGETVNLSFESVHSVLGLLLPVLYVCIICTALAHFLWNSALSKGAATNCAAFYPFQPVTSMLLGVVLLGEKCSVGFLIGTAMILASIVLRQIPWHIPMPVFRRPQYR